MQAGSLRYESKLRLAHHQLLAMCGDRGADFFHDGRMLRGDVEFFADIAREIEEQRRFVDVSLGLAVAVLGEEMQFVIPEPHGRELVLAVIKERALRQRFSREQ